MENIRKLEGIVAGWYKNLPHLPVAGQKWLSQNAWWIVLIWVVLGAFGVMSLLFGAIMFGAVSSVFGPVGVAAGGLVFLLVTIMALFAILMTVLGAIAISPLKAMQKKGWTLLFIIALINALAAILSFIFNFDLPALVWNALLIAVGVYFLFEIHPYFDGAKAGRKKVAAKQKKTEA